jgi:hypothetical protein
MPARSQPPLSENGRVNAALLAARMVLAAVFCASGIAKLPGREGTRATVAAFGVPGHLAGQVTLAVPAAAAFIAIGGWPDGGTSLGEVDRSAHQPRRHGGQGGARATRRDGPGPGQLRPAASASARAVSTRARCSR